jgi:transcriptional regulator with PAS, ATPase and Fis domain
MGRQLVGCSRALRDIHQEIECLAPLNAKVLITGESGVGKTVVARLLHQRSQRTGPLVTINCAALPDALLESELFGMRSTVAGAYRDTRGWLEQAQGGTIILEHVAELSLRMQALLLRFLEDGEIQRVGSDHAHTIGNVRVITETDGNLIQRVATGAFREDLYYRMNVIHIVVPPLRDRPEDVVPLISYFLDTLSAACHVQQPILAEAALATLTAYAWPGNVRQLADVMEQLVLCRGVNPLSVADLPIEIAHELVWPALTVARARARQSTAYFRYERLDDGGDLPCRIVPTRLAAPGRRNH